VSDRRDVTAQAKGTGVCGRSGCTWPRRLAHSGQAKVWGRQAIEKLRRIESEIGRRPSSDASVPRRRPPIDCTDFEGEQGEKLVEVDSRSGAISEARRRFLGRCIGQDGWIILLCRVLVKFFGSPLTDPRSKFGVPIGACGARASHNASQMRIALVPLTSHHLTFEFRAHLAQAPKPPCPSQWISSNFAPNHPAPRCIQPTTE
jgi:hypothetical protein